MKKLIKFVFWTLVVLLLLAVVLVATLPLWLGPVARPVANAVAPKITQTDFNLGHLSLNPYTGRLEVGDVQIGNPKGYSEPRAVALGSLVVSVDPTTVLSEVIHVREVTLSDCFVSYLYGGENNVDNITQLRMNVAGGKEKFEARQRRQEAEAEAEQAKPAADEEEGESRRVVIDRLTISGVKVKLQMLTVPVPTITLTDLGKKSGGLTLTELTTQIWDAILKGASSVGDGAAALGGLINTTASELGTAVKDAGKATGESLKAATDTLQSTADTAVGTVNDGVKTVNDGVKQINDSVKQIGDDVKKTAEAFKGLFRR